MKHNQQGVMLIEALIAIVIFSMGILGVIGLQASTINNTLEARYRTDAAFLANQILSQMWADKGNVASYACNPCQSTNANANLAAWVQQIQGTGGQPGWLPGVTDAANQPTIQIPTPVTDPNTGNVTYQATVTVNWQSPQGNGAHNYVTQASITFN